MKKKKIMMLAALCTVLCAGAVSAGNMALGRPEKKLIDLSWSNPTPDYLKKNLARMEKESPLDGITIRVTGKIQQINGKKFIPGRGNAWSKVKWKYEWFEDSIKTLKGLKFTKFKHNFFYLSAYPPDGDFMSDEGWKIIENNHRIAARIAKETGMKGLLWDIEEYLGYSVWRYGSMKTSLTYDQAWDNAFENGQKMGRAIFGEFPDAVLIMPFMLTVSEYGGQNTSLNVPFINGILDVMPLTGKLLEGDEGLSYHIKSFRDYPGMQSRFRSIIGDRILQKNRSKFNTCVQLAPGFYTDPLFVPEKAGKKYTKTQLDDWQKLGKMKFIRRYLAAAMNTADEYIWVYSERGAWWSKSAERRAAKSWEEQLPGINDIFNGLRNPAEMKCDPKDNLIENGNFANFNDNFGEWQLEMDQKKPLPGKVTYEKGRAIIENFTHGCLKVENWTETEPGKCYYFRVKGHYGEPANGIASVSVTFYDSSKKLLTTPESFTLIMPKTGKTEYVGRFFTVPEKAAYIRILPGVAGQQGGGKFFYEELFLQEY